MPAAPAPFDRQLLRRRRQRAALAAGIAPGAPHVLRAPDFLLAHVADDLIDRLAAVRREFPHALNLVAHTGRLGAKLRGHPGVALVIDADDTPAMLAHCAGPCVLADAEALAFRDGSLDLVVSALALQAVNDLPGTLLQCRRALKPDGLLLAALAGGATLTELRQSFLAAEAETAGGASPRVFPFADVRDLGTLLQRAGFALPVVDSDRLTVTYPDALALMHDLRAMGASNVLAERARRFLRRDTLARACAFYAEHFPAPGGGGRVRATFEILTLTAWVPHDSQQKPLRPGSATSRLAEALGTRERPTGDKAG